MKYTIMTILMMAIITISVNPIFAEHPLVLDDPFPIIAGGGTQSICMNITQIGNVSINGNTGDAVLTSSKAAIAMNYFNSSTDMILNIISPCVSNDNQMGAIMMSSAVQGAQQEYLKNSNLQYVKVWLNTARNYDTASTCGWLQDMNPEYIYKHELGHFAGLYHTTGWLTPESHSLMYPSCNGNYNSLKSGDITQINGFY